MYLLHYIADATAVCAKCFSLILSLSKFHFYLSIHSKKRLNNKCKQLSYGICMHSAVYIRSCLFCFTCEKRELLYITFYIAVVLLNDFTALNSSYILQCSTMYIIYKALLVYGNKTRNQKLKRRLYSKRNKAPFMCDDFFIFISLPRFFPIPHIQHVLFLLFSSFSDERSLRKISCRVKMLK